jgi:hypothetical protein
MFWLAAWAAAMNSAGDGFSNLISILAALTLTRLPLSKLHLRRRIRLGQHPTGHEFSGFFKQ